MHNLWWKIVHVRVWHLDDYDPPGDDGSLQVELCHFARPLLARTAGLSGFLRGAFLIWQAYQASSEALHRAEQVRPKK